MRYVVAAVLRFGDVRHTAGQSYNTETGAGDEGLFPRSGSQLSDLNTFSAVLRDYCVETDPICAGGDVGSTHTSYFDIFTNAAAAWVKEQLSESSGSTSSTTTSSKPSSTSSSSKPKATGSSTESSTETSKVAEVPVIPSATLSVSLTVSSVSVSLTSTATTSASALATSKSAAAHDIGPLSYLMSLVCVFAGKALVLML